MVLLVASLLSAQSKLCCKELNGREFSCVSATVHNLPTPKPPPPPPPPPPPLHAGSVRMHYAVQYYCKSRSNLSLTLF